MTLRWQSDSCQCILDYTTNPVTCVGVYQLCSEHIGLDGQSFENIWNTVTAQNQSYSKAYQQCARKDEYDRILEQGPPTIVDEGE